MQNILQTWETAQKIPLLGKSLISKILGVYIPYTGSISAQIEELAPGYARVSLRDRRSVRNHLKSVHAIALANLGELSTGLAVLTKMGPKQRFVLKELQVKYLKKARGKIMAQAKLNHDQGLVEDQEVLSELFDAQGDKVCEVRAIWRIGAVPAS
jgi:acyl-coenzyme A thioesterase PaaI-like protein